MSNVNPTIEDLTDEQVFAILERYHEIARGNGALELVASEIAGHGLPEIVQEVTETAAELGIVGDFSPAAYRKLTTAVRNYGTRLAAELETARLEHGDRVRIRGEADSRLGVMVHYDAIDFVGSVPGGTEGTYAGMHPNENLSAFALVHVARDVVDLGERWKQNPGNLPETLVVPVYASHVERVQ